MFFKYTCRLRCMLSYSLAYHNLFWLQVWQQMSTFPFSMVSALVSHRHRHPSSRPMQMLSQPLLSQKRRLSAIGCCCSKRQIGRKTSMTTRVLQRQSSPLQLCPRSCAFPHVHVHSSWFCCSSCRYLRSYSFHSWWLTMTKGGLLYHWRCKVLKIMFHRCNVYMTIVLRWVLKLSQLEWR